MKVSRFKFFFGTFHVEKYIGRRGRDTKHVTSTRYSVTRGSIVDAKFYQFRGASWFRGILRYRFTIFFFFYFFHFPFRAPPSSSFLLRCRSENGCRDLKVSITVYNNYRCFKKIWLLSLFRSLLRAPFLRLIVF